MVFLNQTHKVNFPESPPAYPGSQLVKRQHWQRPQEMKWRPVCANVMPHGSMQCVFFSSLSLFLFFFLSPSEQACVHLCAGIEVKVYDT